MGTRVAAAEAVTGGRPGAIVWRLHCYACLICVPFVVIMAVSGALSAFGPQVDAVAYRDLVHVPVGAAPRPYAEQFDAVSRIYRGSTVLDVVPAAEPGLATQVGVRSRSGEPLTVFVNPYTATVLGDRDERTRFSAVVRELHGSLLLGDRGAGLVELVACWSLVLIVTGFGLHWPRRWRPRTRSAWPSRLASAAAVLTLLMLASGLSWSRVWPEPFHAYDVSAGTDPPSIPSLQSGKSVRPGEPDALGQPMPRLADGVPVPRSVGVGGTGGSHAPGEDHSKRLPGEGTRGDDPDVAPASVETLLEAARRAGSDGPVRIVFAQEWGGAQAIVTDTPAGERQLLLDQYTARPLALPAAVGSGVTALAAGLHRGHAGGVAGQVFALVATGAVLGLCGWLVLRWWARRPWRVPGEAIVLSPVRKRVLGGILLAAGVLFPLVAVSLLAVVVLELAVLRLNPRLRRRLGFATLGGSEHDDGA